MRMPLIAGNWKMNLRRESAVRLARELVGHRIAGVDLVVCPPDIYLDAVGAVVKDSTVALGAQDASDRDDGAFTGDTSVTMLADLGCRYVIVGHSERRTVHSESDQIVNAKLKKVLELGLTPIVCVGERLSERESGQTFDVIQRQFEQSFAGLSAEQMAKTVIAYEPVWAIGTGKVASGEQAQEIHGDLRNRLKNRYNPAVADAVRILYGGSVKPDNAAELLGQPDIDGALVGGASLDCKAFLSIAASGASRASDSRT